MDAPLINEDFLNDWERPWETDIVPQLPLIKLVTAERLSDYSQLTLASVKEYLVENGAVSLEPECGVFYEVVQAIDWDSVSKSEETDESIESNEVLLKKIMADRLKTLEAPKPKQGSQRAASTLKRTMALQWQNPDLPLWLMQAPALQVLVKPLLPKTHRCTIDQIKEVTKNNSSSFKTGLHTASKQPIALKGQGNTDSLPEKIVLRSYAESGQLGELLLKHLRKMASARVGME